MGILRQLKVKDLVTLLGTTCGMISIIISLDGRFLWVSGAFIYFSMIFDLLDGLVAKIMKQANELGKQLDSLSDSICFGVAPAVLIYRYYSELNSFAPIVLAILCVIYVFGAILRLTWFNISQQEGYEGVTTPVTASILLSLFFIDLFYGYFPDMGPLLGKILNYVIPISMIFLAYLNITRFLIYGKGVKSRENRKFALLLILAMTIGLIASILTFFDHTATGPYIYGLCVAILVILTCYLIIGLCNFFRERKILGSICESKAR
ncbi:MAG: CDP-alcohol phosphatidyltransferase family protein [Candidatus Lokiarchaeota archaeon]|nr:CDP-alcohol phosphatidyltransferase family protein [Candidatus Lokiarchaeota archaeon]